MAKLILTEEQWDGLLKLYNGDYRWLPVCCGNISAAREALREIRASEGTITMGQSWIIYENAIHHDAIEDAWKGKPTKPSSRFLTDAGTPWPSIFSVIRSFIINEAS